MMNCEFCGSPAHVWFSCPKKPDGWKPDRLKRSRLASDDEVAAAISHRMVPKERVVTNTTGKPVTHEGQTIRPGETSAVLDPVTVPVAKPRGRPRIHPDRKAYLAMKARERRARNAAKKSQ